LRLPFVAMMIRGVRPYYTMTFVDVLVILPFVAVMIRGDDQGSPPILYNAIC